MFYSPRRGSAWPTWFCAAMALLGSSFLSADALAADREHAKLINQVFVNDSNYKLLMTAENVTACLLNTEQKGFNYVRNPKYTEGAAVDVPADVLAELRLELKNPAAYSLITLDERRKGGFGASGCDPLYAVRFHFRSREKEIGVNFCFGCGHIALSRGEKIFHEFEGLRKDAKFLDLSARLFPESADLKTVIERRKTESASIERVP